MENISIARYTRLLAPLSAELKLKLIEWLTKSLLLDIKPKSDPSKKSEEELIDDIYEVRSSPEVNTKEKRLRKLAGSWNDVDDEIAQ